VVPQPQIRDEALRHGREAEAVARHAETRREIVAGGRPAEFGIALEHEDARAAPRKARGGRQAVKPAADDDRVVTLHASQSQPALVPQAYRNDTPRWDVATAPAREAPRINYVFPGILWMMPPTPRYGARRNPARASREGASSPPWAGGIKRRPRRRRSARKARARRPVFPEAAPRGQRSRARCRRGRAAP